VLLFRLIAKILKSEFRITCRSIDKDPDLGVNPLLHYSISKLSSRYTPGRNCEGPNLILKIAAVSNLVSSATYVHTNRKKGSRGTKGVYKD
jgi:hypothetical protein